MSTFAATSLALLLSASILIPILLAHAMPGLRMPVALLYGGMAVALLAYYSDKTQYGATLVTEAAAGGALVPNDALRSGGRCEEALELSERAGLIRDSTVPGRLIVGELWMELPEVAKGVLIQCAEIAQGNSADGKLEIITSGEPAQ